MSFLRRAVLGAALVAGLALAAPAAAQQAPAYTLDQVERLLRAGVPGIIDDLRKDCIAFDVTDAAVSRLRAAGADDAFVQALRGVCKRLPEPERRPAEPQPQARSAGVTPGSAAVRSLLLPGLGQFATGRPAIGVAFMLAWGGALGYGLMTQEVTTECLARVSGPCPSGDVRDEVVKRPALAIGVGAALAVAVFSALEARSAARRMAAAPGGPDARRLGIEPVLPAGSGDGVGLRLRLRF